jgi:hypothetical protein
MFGFLGKSEPATPSLGVNLSENRVAKVELNALSKKFVDEREKISKHMTKMNKDREVADKLAGHFIHNYYVMIDISSLLNQYAEFFATIKDALIKSDIQMDQLNAANFQNLEKLTRQEMDKFTTKFAEQADKVKKLFVSYNMNDQAAKLSAIPQMSVDLGTAAEAAIQAAPRKPPTSFGGSKRYLKKITVNMSNGGKQKTKRSKAQG